MGYLPSILLSSWCCTPSTAFTSICKRSLRNKTCQRHLQINVMSSIIWFTFRSEQVAGFALVIDRRSEDWNSVRTVFQKVVSLFPARIREVYLLHHRRHHNHHHQPQLPNKDLIAHQLIHDFLLDFDIYVLDDQSELQQHINPKYLPVNLGGEANGKTCHDLLLLLETQEYLPQVNLTTGSKFKIWSNRLALTLAG